MKPAHPLSWFVLSFFGFSGSVWAQAPAAAPADTQPAALAPAPPPAPAPPAEAAPPPASELPPPPPPKSVPPPPQGKMVLTVPPVPEARERKGYHVHDGFYLRVGAGLGIGGGSVSTDSNRSSNFTLGGAGLGLNVWVGGTPWKGVAIGGLFSYHGISEPNTRVEGDETDEKLAASMVMLGFFADVFPEPQSGLHFGGSLGLAGMSTKARSDRLEAPPFNAPDYEGGGLGLSAWIGYMGFVGPEWSLGGMLQGTGVLTTKDEDDIKRQGTGGVISLSFTALCH